MAKITFIIGLCGSGKTHYSEVWRQKTGAKIFEGIGKSIGGNTNWSAIINHLNAGEDCIIEEMNFCFQDPRNEIIRYILNKASGTKIEWVCFENNLESANWNVRQRTNKGDIDGHLKINEQLHRDYTYQPGVEIIPITRIESK